MATQVEKRAKLEATLAKLDPVAIMERAEKRRETLEKKIGNMQQYRSLEGQSAMFQLRPGILIPVVIKGYERTVYNREMFRVATVDGGGKEGDSWMTSRSKILLPAEVEAQKEAEQAAQAEE